MPLPLAPQGEEVTVRKVLTDEKSAVILKISALS